MVCTRLLHSGDSKRTKKSAGRGPRAGTHEKMVKAGNEAARDVWHHRSSLRVGATAMHVHVDKSGVASRHTPETRPRIERCDNSY
jgi:hypothetical protein